MSDAAAGRTLDSNLFITVSGRSGTGVTTLCEGLSEALNCGYISGGEVFREVADERDMSLTQLIAEASASESPSHSVVTPVPERPETVMKRLLSSVRPVAASDVGIGPVTGGPNISTAGRAR